MLSEKVSRRCASDGRINLFMNGIVGIIHTGRKADVVRNVTRADHLHQAFIGRNATIPDKIHQTVDEEVHALVIGVVKHAIQFLHEAHVPAVAIPWRVASRIDFVLAGKISLAARSNALHADP